MGDLDALFTSLGASFEAQIEHEEERAAADLAFSLLQDRTIEDALARGGPCSLAYRGVRLPITVIGQNFLAGGRPPRVLVPTGRAAVTSDPAGEPPDVSAEELLGVLRAWARQQRRVEVDLGHETFRGVLQAARRDHLYLQTRAGWALAPIGALASVTALPGGAGDGS